LNKNITNQISEAVSFHKRGQFEQARKIYEMILQKNPNNTQILKLIGAMELQCKNFTKSIHYLDKAIKSNNNIAELYSLRGTVELELKKYDTATNNFKKAIEIDKDFKDAYFNLGFISKYKNELIKAVNYFDKVTLVDKKNVRAFSNKAFIKIQLRDFNSALSDLNKAIEYDPNYINAYLQRGNIYKELKLFDESLKDYNKVLSFKDSEFSELYNEALFNISHLYLLRGKFTEGWKLYENRFKINSHPLKDRIFLKPLLQSIDNLENKTILILGEQGIGDNIQFSRYLPLLKKKCSKIIFQVDTKLKFFFEQTNVADEIYSFDKNILDYDYYCHLMSLPNIFKTTISNIPKVSLKIKKNDQDLQKWNLKFKHNNKKFKVGINWEAKSNIPGKSVPLKFFYKLSLFKNLNLYSLQKDHGLNQIKENNFKIFEFDNFDKVGLFSDTVSLINNLDLIITIDTSIAHLAGSICNNVWVILNDVPEWRWLLDTDKSPWYESVKLFRCKKKDDWSTVFDEIENSLVQFKD